MNIIRLLTVSTFISLGWYFYQSNDQHNYYVIFAIIACILSLAYQLLTLYKKQNYLGFIRSPFQIASLKYLLIIAMRWTFIFVCLSGYNEMLVKAQVTEAQHHAELLLLGILMGLVAASCTIVKKQIDHIFNACLLIATFSLGLELFKAYNPPPLSEAVALSSPFQKTFSVLNGGESRFHSNAKNSKRRTRSYITQLAVTGEKFAKQTRDAWTDFPHTFGEPIYAPASGIVLAVNNSHIDASFDNSENRGGPGNFILVEIGPEQFMMLFHLKKDSLLVDAGDLVTLGQPIAQCGKSGQTSDSVLGICIFTKPDIFDETTRSYPIYFKDVHTLPHSDRSGPFFAKRNQRFSPIDLPLNQSNANALPNTHH